MLRLAKCAIIALLLLAPGCSVGPSVPISKPEERRTKKFPARDEEVVIKAVEPPLQDPTSVPADKIVAKAAGVPVDSHQEVLESESENDSEIGVCSNVDLRRAIEIIQSSCTDKGCDPDSLERLDQQVDRPALLAALRRKDLNPVVLFFETGGAGTGSILDWRARKDQLLSIRMSLDRPEDAILFIIGKASAVGSSKANELISERRVSSVHQFLRENDIECGEIRVGFLGETALELTTEDAQFYLDLPEESYRASRQVLNQSVFVFTYPCRNQLGASAKTQRTKN